MRSGYTTDLMKIVDAPTSIRNYFFKFNIIFTLHRKKVNKTRKLYKRYRVCKIHVQTAVVLYSGYR